MPLAREATLSGMKVIGYDLNHDIVDDLNAGISHIDDLSNLDISQMLGIGFKATCQETELGVTETVVICVPTPLAAGNAPDLSAVCAATHVAGRLLRSGMLVVLESTTYPGTTDE